MPGEQGHHLLTGTALHVPFHYEQDADPGAVGAGKYWLDTNSGPPRILYRRNAADDGWDEVGGGGVTDHGALTGLSDDDHPNYALSSELNTHEGAADPHTGYQKESEKAAASGYASLDGSTLVPVAQLATGTPDGTKFLRDDRVWAVPVAGQVVTMNMVIDGGGAVVSTGIKGDLVCDFAGTIEGVTLLADQSGSIVVDIWKDTYANFPPVVGDSICAAAKPTITTATKSQNTTLTGWTTAIAAGDILRFNVDSATTVTRVTVALKVRRV